MSVVEPSVPGATSAFGRLIKRAHGGVQATLAVGGTVVRWPIYAVERLVIRAAAVGVGVGRVAAGVGGSVVHVVVAVVRATVHGLVVVGRTMEGAVLRSVKTVAHTAVATVLAVLLAAVRMGHAVASGVARAVVALVALGARAVWLLIRVGGRALITCLTAVGWLIDAGIKGIRAAVLGVVHALGALVQWSFERAKGSIEALAAVAMSVARAAGWPLMGLGRAGGTAIRYISRSAAGSVTKARQIGVGVAMSIIRKPEKPETPRRLHARVPRTAPSREAYRQVFVSLNLPRGSNPVIGVTSAIAGEGRTTVALGLARTLAADLDTIVLLVEVDTERPALAQRLSLPPSPGLPGVLKREIDLTGAVCQVDDGLFVVASDEPEPDTGRLLRRLPLDDPFHRKNFPGITVLDLPPILGHSYSPLAVSVADALVLVIRAGVTPAGVVQEALRRLEDPPQGVVLNGAKSHVPPWWPWDAA